MDILAATENSAGPLAEGLLLQYWNVLRKRRWVVVAFTGFLLTSVTIGTLLSTSYYAATTVIEISPKTDTVLDVDEVSEFVTASSSSELRNYYATQYKIMQSRSTIERAIKILREKHGITDFDEEEKPVRAFLSNLTVQPIVETHLVSISYEHPDPQRAMLYADVLAEAYMAANLERALESSTRALAWLNDQVEVFRSRQLESDLKVVQFRADNGLVGSSEQYSSSMERMASVQTAWSAASTARIQIEAVYNQLAELAQSPEQSALAQHLSVTNPQLGALLTRRDELQRNREQLRSRVGEKHPDLLEVDSELAAAKGQIQQILNDIVRGRRAELEVARNQEASLAAELALIQEDVKDLDRKLVDLKILEAEAERNRQFHQSIDKRLSEVDLSHLLRNNNIRIIDAAVATDSPVRPKLPVNLAMGLVLGLFGGCALAFFIEFLDTTVKSREDVEQVLGVPLLGVVPGLAPEELLSLPGELDRNLFVHARPRSTVAECLRSIRANVFFRTPNKKVRTLLITSAAPREGKSFTSSNLAAIIAMSGNRVLLIDADLRRPSLHKRFCVPNDIGLCSAFTEDTPLRALARPTHIDGLDLIVAGPPPPNPGELLSAGRLQAALVALTGYDVIIIDSPPVNVVADPLVLSEVADGVLLVVEANRTSRSMVRQAGARLAETNARVIGAIVNKLDIKTSGYSYNYYDSYGYYYTEAEQEADAQQAG
jgi:capsular exopolysaccharide synthesis family protein